MAGDGEDAHLGVRDARSIVVDSPGKPLPDAGVTNPSAQEKRSMAGRVAMSELTRNRLAVQLQAMYRAVAQQPVPERFADLIAQLDARERDKS